MCKKQSKIFKGKFEGEMAGKDSSDSSSVSSTDDELEKNAIIEEPEV